MNKMNLTYASKSLLSFSNSSNYLNRYRSFLPNSSETHSFVNPPYYFIALLSSSYESTAIPTLINEMNYLGKFLPDSINCDSYVKKIRNLVDSIQPFVNEKYREIYIEECMEKARDDFINLFSSSDIPDISLYKDFFKKAYSLSDDKNINICIDYESVSVNITYKNKFFNIEQYFEDTDDVVITCANIKNSAISVCNYKNLQLYMDKY